MKQQFIKFLFLTALFAMTCTSSITAQLTATARVSTDSLLLGNTCLLTVEVEGGQIDDVEVDFPPSYNLVSGPNVSSSISIINGTRSQKSTYSYYLEPTEVGSEYIPPVVVRSGEEVLETQPIEVHTYPNPENIRQEIPNQSQQWFKFDMGFDNMFEPFSQPQHTQEMPAQKPNKRPLKRI